MSQKLETKGNSIHDTDLENQNLLEPLDEFEENQQQPDLCRFKECYITRHNKILVFTKSFYFVIDKDDMSK